jgi:uncharacterized membrane protein (UPF0127 family)
MAVLCRLSYSSVATAMIRARHRPRPALLAALLVLAACGEADTRSGPPRGTTLVIEARGGDVEVDVEIADTPRTRAKGLMGRTELPSDAGMVFLEDEPMAVGFWMKDTLIPLSIAFWGPERRILAILDMQPCREDPCPTYDPGVAWIGALEVNQGFFEEHGVDVGDAVHLER